LSEHERIKHLAGDPDEPGQHGFSLIELMVSSVIMLFFLAAAYSVSDQMQNIGIRSQLRAGNQQASRMALERLESVIRMAGNDPQGVAFPSGFAMFPTSTATELRLRMDLPFDDNDDGDTWDVVDGNGDNDADDDNENENGDGFINDPGEDLTFTYDAGAQTITMTDNTTGDAFIIAERVQPNPGGTALFTYVRDAVSNDPIRVILTVTVASATDDLLTNDPALYTLTTTIGPRLEAVPDIGFVEANAEAAEVVVKK
jgi:prepilin-type N-terminal cleavage/methylation domain-containing protein